GEVICFAAKVYGESEVQFFSTLHDGKETMVSAAHEMLDQADAVIHFNGQRFDIPHLNRELVDAALTPASPYPQTDLLKDVKTNCRCPSNKLDYVTKKRGLESKVQSGGHQLSVKCRAEDCQAWEQMKEYNIQELVSTERL